MNINWKKVGIVLAIVGVIFVVSDPTGASLFVEQILSWAWESLQAILEFMKSIDL